ncbi:MAG: Alanine--tRNA ligase [Anaerolinea thermophila]|uniref:Alanine--tRNA ligase n=1 Tax=Anaerolinea thermophila TaxID=167964 RepID=A0A101FX82_9CHLR|nr:MAG: Alanine--tRNA ligase [Anaerolinea thermophila]
MSKKRTGAQIRQEFIDFFVEHSHTFVPSSPLVPGGDSTLLFTNAGMVQFKDVFLGTDQRPYTRAVNSQKCLRVSGKHNDLEQVGRDNTHHTFFEMLGNWSFGDYYKKEAITWAWQLLTEVWEMPKDRLWATYFKDELNEIPEDREAAEIWLSQPGFNPDHLLAFGRKENFWEMADTGPCGPDSEIHFDRGPAFCTKSDDPDHVCKVNGDCGRFLEFWNNVFIQYNRVSPTEIYPLEKKHIDTGMGLERIVSILQDKDSNYKTDLFMPLIKRVQDLTGHTDAEREADLTPYRVIADHARATSFLIADGVVPGNIGRNYVCRMLVRRAARFGMKLGLNKPFMAEIAKIVVDEFGAFYPELKRNQKTILDNLTREEEQFQRTVKAGLEHLDELLGELKEEGKDILEGEKAFDLYATLGLPLEITRDIAQEQGLEVDTVRFQEAMEEHRLASGAGKAFGEFGGEDVEVFTSIFEALLESGKLGKAGVEYNPYQPIDEPVEILALIKDGQPVEKAEQGDAVQVLLPKTWFYVESGGQVSDTGQIISAVGDDWVIQISDMRKPAAGIIVHQGEVVKGQPKVGDLSLAQVDVDRRVQIQRNHTATHLLHAALHKVLGDHARQAGSLVAPDRLRFDFTHPQPMTREEILAVEAHVNQSILADYKLNITQKPLQEAIEEGAMALFGEKYESVVRTIIIGDDERLSYELCGGTHVDETGDIGLFLVTYESSIAAGIRRIEAVTGWRAYQLARERMNTLDEINHFLGTSPSEALPKIKNLSNSLSDAQKEIETLQVQHVASAFDEKLADTEEVEGIPVMLTILPGASMEALREMADKFRQHYQSGVALLASEQGGKPILIAAVTDDLVERGLHAGKLVGSVAKIVGGGGGGRPTLAQAGGKDPSKLSEALDSVRVYIRENLK